MESDPLKMFDQLHTNLNLATMDPRRSGQFGEIHNAKIGVENGRIAWIGPAAGAPQNRIGSGTTTIDHGGCWATPGLIDCHTHLVFGDDRSAEFAQRLAGATYEEIARSGGGIISTVKATRTASLEELVDSGRPRMAAMIRSGITTIEIKSGYGLDVETELRMLEAATILGKEFGIKVQRTLLGLHSLPPEYKDNRAGYIDLVAEKMIPEAKARGLADAVDAFCENIGFTTEEVDWVFKAAKSHGLKLKLHAEQLSNLNGAALAASHGALSADHLEHIDEPGVAAMAEAGAIAVLLPGAFYTLNETQKPPVDLFRKYKVPIAIASDLNPGSSPVLSSVLMMNMASTMFRLTPDESLAGMTRNAALALGMEDDIGILREGMRADIAIWNIRQPSDLSYWVGLPGPARLFAGGAEMALKP